MASNTTHRTSGRYARTVRRRRVAELTLAGFEQRAIAGELQVSQGTVSKDLARVVADDREASADAIRELRTRELVSLEGMELATVEGFNASATARTQQRWLDSRLRIMQRRAALCGLDAPTRSEVHATVGAEYQTDDDLSLVRAAFVSALAEGLTIDAIEVGLIGELGTSAEADVRMIARDFALELQGEQRQLGPGGDGPDDGPTTTDVDGGDDVIDLA